MTDTFPIAYSRARHKVGETGWSCLSDAQQAAAVAEELRLLQQEFGTTPDNDTEAHNRLRRSMHEAGFRDPA